MSDIYVISYDLMKDIMAVPRSVLGVPANQAINFDSTIGMMKSALNKVGSAGIQAGINQAYDAYWDCQQENGARTDYHKFFAKGWNDEICKPKWKMPVSNASSMFDGCKVQNLNECLNGTLDTSNCHNFTYMFFEALSEEMPLVVIPSGLELWQLDFAYSCCYNMVTANIQFNEGVGEYPSTMFEWSQKLTNLNVSGVIANGGLDFSTCQDLSKQSVKNLFGLLSDDTQGLTIAFAQRTVRKGFETHPDWWDGLNSAEWKDLVASKPNWTILILPEW